jgi:hypothetical protein
MKTLENLLGSQTGALNVTRMVKHAQHSHALVVGKVVRIYGVDVGQPIIALVPINTVRSRSRGSNP